MTPRAIHAPTSVLSSASARSAALRAKRRHLERCHRLHDEAHYVRLGQAGPRRRVGGVEPDGLAEMRSGERRAAGRIAAEREAPLEVRRVRGGRGPRHRREIGRLAPGAAEPEGVEYRHDDLVLDRDQVVRGALVRFRPDVEATLDAHEADAESKAVARRANAAEQYRPDTQPPARRRGIGGIGHGGGTARRDAQPGYPPQGARDVPADPFAQIVVRRIGTVIEERHDGDGMRRRSRRWRRRGNAGEAEPERRGQQAGERHAEDSPAYRQRSAGRHYGTTCLTGMAPRRIWE